MKKVVGFIILIIVLSIISYAFLGGFKSIEKSVEQNPLIHIAGIEYKGKIGSDSLQQLFMESKDLVESEETATSIAIVYYGEADNKSGAVHNFVGVVVGDNPVYEMPDKWEIKTFKKNHSVKGCIEANVLAMPTPEDMLEELRIYAEEQSLATDSIFIEYYPGPNQLCVELLGME